MNYMSQVAEQTKKIWYDFRLWQRATIVGVIFAAFVGIAALLILSNTTTYEPLYTNLDPRDASAIAAKLKELNVEYKLADEGNTILVAAEDKYQLRLDMAGEITLQGIVGFESFNETRFGETDTDKRVRFLVALQGELTRTIEELDEVETAKVHIALPQPSLFIKDKAETTASVLLRLKPYASLKPEQINSIMSFVSHSVEGLKTSNVTIMDVNGNLLSQGIAEEGAAAASNISVTQIALKQKYEQDLARSIQSMLEQMRGPGKAVVRVNVTMDFDKVETYSEQYGNSVLASEQVKEENSTGTTTTSGENPADSNMGGTSYGETGSNGLTKYELVERTRNYDVSKVVETKTAAPGKVNRVSVSVLIDGEMTEAEQEKVSETVGKAAGIDIQRGDQVSIVAMPFNTEAVEQLESQIIEAEKVETRNEYIKMGLYGLGILLVFGLVFFILRNLKNMPRTQLTPVMETAAAAVPVPRDITMSLNPEAAEKKLIRQQIDQLVETNPEDVAKVLKTWMIEE